MTKLADDGPMAVIFRGFTCALSLLHAITLYRQLHEWNKKEEAASNRFYDRTISNKSWTRERRKIAEGIENLELDHLRDVNRVLMDAIRPWPVGGRSDSPVTLPDGAVTLEATSEGDLPHSVALLHPPLGLNVTQFIPQGRRRGVSKAVERHSRRLHVLRW